MTGTDRLAEILAEYRESLNAINGAAPSAPPPAPQRTDPRIMLPADQQRASRTPVIPNAATRRVSWLQ